MKYVFSAIILVGLLYMAFQFGAAGIRFLRYGNHMADGLVNSYRTLRGMEPAGNAPVSSAKENENAPPRDNIPAQPASSNRVRKQYTVTSTPLQFNAKRDTKLPSSLAPTAVALPPDPPAGGTIRGTTIVSEDATAQSLGEAARRARGKQMNGN
jgi:hypothetical protein